MNPDQETRLARIEARVEEAARLARRTYQILLWTGIITVAAIVLPLIFFAFTLPSLLSGVSALTGGI